MGANELLLLLRLKRPKRCRKTIEEKQRGMTKSGHRVCALVTVCAPMVSHLFIYLSFFIVFMSPRSFFFVCSDFRGENLPALSCHSVMGRMNGIIFRFQAAATTTSSSRSYIFWWLLACVKATVKAAARAHGSPHYSPKYLKIVFFFFLISGQREREKERKKKSRSQRLKGRQVCVCVYSILYLEKKKKKKVPPTALLSDWCFTAG